MQICPQIESDGVVGLAGTHVDHRHILGFWGILSSRSTDHWSELAFGIVEGRCLTGFSGSAIPAAGQGKTRPLIQAAGTFGGYSGHTLRFQHLLILLFDRPGVVDSKSRHDGVNEDNSFDFIATGDEQTGHLPSEKSTR